MISEESLVLSSFVGKKIEFYRKMLLMIILKKAFSQIIFGTCIQLAYQRPFDTYVNACLQIAGYVLKSTCSFPSPFATNSSYPFDNSSQPPFTTQFSPHILSKVFDQSFYISSVFQNLTFDLFCFSCQIWIIYTRIELKSLITHRFQNVLPVVTWNVNTPCKTTNTSAQCDRSNVQLISYNSV
jgi:hypothetical protein